MDRLSAYGPVGDSAATGSLLAGEARCSCQSTFYIYDRSEQLPQVALARSEYGLPEGAFVFCCFNNYYKIEPEIFSLWMEILKAVPSSILWLAGRDPAAVGNLRREAEKRGVDGRAAGVRSVRGA